MDYSQVANWTSGRQLCDAQFRPDRFGGWITIYPDDVEWSVKEIERAAAMGLYGWMASSNYHSKHLDDHRYWPILAKFEELGMPIYIHPEFSQVPDIAEFGYCITGPTFGFMTDALTCFMRMMCRGVFDKYPNLKIILWHDGEALPFLLDRVNTAYRQYRADKSLSTVCEYEHEPSYYILHNVWLTTSGNFSTGALRCCIDAMPAGCVMMSTDYSYENFPGSVSFIRDNEKLTAVEKKAIQRMHANECKKASLARGTPFRFLRCPNHRKLRFFDHLFFRSISLVISRPQVFGFV